MHETYCSEHKREAKQTIGSEYNKNKRNSKHQKFYSSREWRRVRKSVMEEFGGLCKMCAKFDMIVEADVVDHIVPISADYSKRLEKDNLQPLCHSCHNKKTADDLLRYGEGA